MEAKLLKGNQQLGKWNMEHYALKGIQEWQHGRILEREFYMNTGGNKGIQDFKILKEGFTWIDTRAT